LSAQLAQDLKIRVSAVRFRPSPLPKSKRRPDSVGAPFCVLGSVFGRTIWE